MATNTIRPTAMPWRVCNFCRVALNRPVLKRPFSRLYSSQRQPTSPRRSSPHFGYNARPSHRLIRRVSTTLIQDSASQSNPVAAIQTAEQLGQQLLNSESIPPEEQILEALAACESAASDLVEGSGSPSRSNDPSATSTLLSLDSRREPTAVPIDVVDGLSQLSFDIIAHPLVFLSPPVLKVYVKIQCLLSRPESFPEVFTMYAHKPVPRRARPGSDSPVLSNPNPNNISQAVPYTIAEEALDSAIVTKNLDLVLAIINSTFRTKAYRNNRLFRKASIPLTGAVLAPAAAWIVASRISTFQDFLDGPTATSAAFAGILTYLGATSTLGYISLTTHNDQMERVVWRPGMGLTERWAREDERAAIDRVALAWGFKDTYKRGLEEGEEWESLRTWIAERGMILDKTELMEGME